MTPQTLCALLNVRGQIDLDLLRECAISGARSDHSELELLEDPDLPILGEASESHVLQSISRRIGLTSNGRHTQLLHHRYSPDHVLLAFTMPSASNRPESMLKKLQFLLSLYADAIGTPVTCIPSQKLVLKMGEDIKLSGDWCWDRSRTLSDEVLQLISACYIAVYLLTGAPAITLELPTLSADRETLCPLTPVSLTMDANLPVGTVFAQLKRSYCALSDNFDKDVPVARAAVLAQLIPPTLCGFYTSAMNVSVVDIRYSGSWALRLTFPRREQNTLPRVECNLLPNHTAADLLGFLYKIFETDPARIIAKATLSAQ
jgi:hypothetical protein